MSKNEMSKNEILWAAQEDIKDLASIAGKIFIVGALVCTANLLLSESKEKSKEVWEIPPKIYRRTKNVLLENNTSSSSDEDDMIL